MDVSLMNYNHTQLRQSLPYFTGFALLLQYFLEIPRIIEIKKKKQQQQQQQPVAPTCSTVTNNQKLLQTLTNSFV